jgi:hypothetical protein
MAKLSADETRLLRDALLDAYDRAAFEELLQLHLDRRLEHIAPGRASLREEALSVIHAAEEGSAEQRWTADLLRAAAAERPSSAPLQDVVHQLLARVAAPEERPDCPYPGMKPFDAKDARFFYGREQEIDEMLRRLYGQRLLLVIGPSGSGKSSLINAGLLPRLVKARLFAPGYWLVRAMRPGADPMASLGEALDGNPTQPEKAVAALLAANPPAQRLLLVVDQFEEVFTSQVTPEARRDFIAAIQALRRAEACTLLLAVRADFYPDLMDSDLWQAVKDQRTDVVPLRGDALEEAIIKPAEQSNVQVEPALVERLMADAANEPGVLPMLQQTLVLLWDQMEDRRLTLDAYQKLGDGARSGLAAAIGLHADAIYGGLSPEQKATARRIVLRLIQFGEGRADTRRQQPEGALRAADDDPGAFATALDTLAQNRLLTLSGGEDGGERQVDISHEALIAGWPRLQAWLEERRAAEQTRRRLEAKAEEWQRLGAGAGGLLDEAELPEAERWLAGEDAAQLGSSDELRTFAVESRAALNRAMLEHEATRRRELQLEQRARRQLQYLALALGVLLAASLTALGRTILYPEYQRLRARQEGNPIRIPELDIAMETDEVTNQRYLRCVRAGYCKEPGSGSSYYPAGTNQDLPVAAVGAMDAAIFCQWVGRRLPWGYEIAAKPGQANVCFTDCELGLGEPHPVGSYAKGNSPEGIRDLVGNVAEWTSTELIVALGFAAIGEEWRDGDPATIPEYLAVAGGGFESYAETALFTPYVSYYPYRDVGIRCVEDSL